MTKNQTFSVVGAVQYEIQEIESRTREIAEWAYLYYSHAVEDPRKEQEIEKKLQSDGYLEQGDKMYLLCKPPQDEQ